MYFKKKIIAIKFFLLVIILSLAPISFAQNATKSLTDLFKGNWHFKAFLAIPAVEKIRPRLALKTNVEGRIIGRSRCVEIDRLEQRRVYDPLAKMVNEQLHRVACRAMKMAIKEIDYLPIFEKLEPGEEILLTFDFSKGIVSSAKALYKPIQINPEDIENSS